MQCSLTSAQTGTFYTGTHQVPNWKEKEYKMKNKQIVFHRTIKQGLPQRNYTVN